MIVLSSYTTLQQSVRRNFCIMCWLQFLTPSPLPISSPLSWRTNDFRCPSMQFKSVLHSSAIVTNECFKSLQNTACQTSSSLCIPSFSYTSQAFLAFLRIFRIFFNTRILHDVVTAQGICAMVPDVIDSLQIKYLLSPTLSYVYHPARTCFTLRLPTCVISRTIFADLNHLRY